MRIVTICAALLSMVLAVGAWMSRDGGPLDGRWGSMGTPVPSTRVLPLLHRAWKDGADVQVLSVDWEGGRPVCTLEISTPMGPAVDVNNYVVTPGSASLVGGCWIY